MKHFSIFFSVLLFLSTLACAPVEERQENAARICTEPRPQVCTMIYAPVCATHSDAHQETHASACNACADDTVISHLPGSCEEPSP